MSLKVLVISHMYPNPANPMSGIFVHNQVKALKQAGVECRVLSPIPRFPLYPKWRVYRRFPAQAVMDGIPIHYLPTWMFPGGMFFSSYGRLYYMALSSVLPSIRERFPFDLIHCHTIYPDGYAGGMLKEKFSVPVVSTIHGSDILLYPHRSRGVFRHTEQALRMNDHIIAVSNLLMKEAQQVVAGVDVSTIYNGFDPSRFYPMDSKAARKKLEISPEEKVALFVGNLKPVKGLQVLLEAFCRVVKQVPQARLVLVGDGPLRSALKRQVRECDLEERVTFAGRRPHDEIPLWINGSDVVVLPSLSEGFGGVVLEAMGCGKPVVATDVAGASEIVQHRKTGYLVKPEDSEGLAQYLTILLKDEGGLIGDMGERAYAASGSYTWKQNASQVIELYHRLLSRR
ncbi:N-acetyl-alpha-D-glucosaminyl L-malate synthase BshA [Planifilum fimeticola]|jgi:teichuronic acid biosynthesis glycosyltransferase TuaC|uniref:N-acetyl-alpha-D-glucosaminyl L-malate synthase BshA n=1 Tax=Planifilum fimeticola TaxID=201975 RepID=A0A2T0LHU0_9BACL|nr:glycosyltransferase family 4 protein [Planifilum fimeticola]PRX41995.1 N-acetyl-alpha-D-glucosaminyl L-malate synthase BshA [Planifilum fimeticola]